MTTGGVSKVERKSRWVLVAGMAAAILLLAGIGYAFAQEQPQAAPQGEAQEGRFGPGGPDGGSGGPGGGRGMPPGLRGKVMGGEVVKVEDNTITLKTRSGEEKSVKVDENTKYRKKDGDASLDDVKPGEKIGVRLAKAEEGSEPTAKAVIIGEPPQGGGQNRPQPIVGEITQINGDTVTIKTAEGDKQVKIPGLTQGMRVGVVADEDGTARVVMYDPPERPQGGPPGPGDGGAPPEGA